PGRASAGDELYITKWIALEGTALLATERSDALRAVLGDEVVDRAASLLADPGISVTTDARLALATGLVTALHDPTEGGLATALQAIAEASGLGVRGDAEKVPILPETRSITEHLD